MVGDDIVGVMPLPQGCGEAVRCGAGSDNEISASNMVSTHPTVSSTRPGKHRTLSTCFCLPDIVDSHLCIVNSHVQKDVFVSVMSSGCQ